MFKDTCTGYLVCPLWIIYSTSLCPMLGSRGSLGIWFCWETETTYRSKRGRIRSLIKSHRTSHEGSMGFMLLPKVIAPIRFLFPHSFLPLYLSVSSFPSFATFSPSSSLFFFCFLSSLQAQGWEESLAFSSWYCTNPSVFM